ncbi:hypothetical protein BDZ91DRAFT_787269 [Kalaharituber pfeilii]|nr:hypothetical protein BDZ91DRAFT_787269 [Kalaharituber pfeilii]
MQASRLFRACCTVTMVSKPIFRPWRLCRYTMSKCWVVGTGQIVRRRSGNFIVTAQDKAFHRDWNGIDFKRMGKVPVTLMDSSQTSVDKTIVFIGKLLQADVAKQRITDEQAKEIRKWEILSFNFEISSKPADNLSKRCVPAKWVKSVKEVYDPYWFKNYFSNAPNGVFPVSPSSEEAVEIAIGGWGYIKKIFSKAELIAKEPRVVAMTSAFRKPLFLLCYTRPEGELSFQCIKLLSDHHQNSAIIQNFALHQHAELEQSTLRPLCPPRSPAVAFGKLGRTEPYIAALLIALQEF